MKSLLRFSVPSPHTAFLLVFLAVVCAACDGAHAPDGAAAAAVALGAEQVAAEEPPPGIPASAVDAPRGDDAAAPRDPDGSTETEGVSDRAGDARAGDASAASAGDDPSDDAAPRPRPVFPRPEHVRALYLNAWTAGSRKRVDELIGVAKRTEINAFVIDVKDASGYVSHDTRVPLAREIGATGQLRIRDLPGLLAKLEAAGIYPIARIVIVRDPLLAEGRPALTVQNASGQPWHDDKGIVWMNIAQEGVWKYNVDLAEEVARMGFPEIQWDYVRFPDAPRSVLATARFPGLEGDKADAVGAFFQYARKRLDDLGLDVAMTADVFGITTSAKDVGIGQVWERFIDRVDVALPMVYPSHYYPGSFGYKKPNAYPYEIVRHALERALERSKPVAGAGHVRPYLQDFNLGPPSYGAPEVRAQIQAAYDVGVDEWVLWNAGSHYTESALQPEGGWKEEPRIRIADRVVPVSERFAALDAAAAVAAKVDEPEAGGAAADAVKSTGAKPAGAKSSDAQPPDAKPAEAKSTGGHPTDAKAGAAKPVPPKPVPGVPGAAEAGAVEAGRAAPAGAQKQGGAIGG